MNNIWNDPRTVRQSEKQERLADFNPDGWTQHTKYHFSQVIGETRLDYYPSTINLCMNGTPYRGVYSEHLDVYELVRNLKNNT